MVGRRALSTRIRHDDWQRRMPIGYISSYPRGVPSDWTRTASHWRTLRGFARFPPSPAVSLTVLMGALLLPFGQTNGVSFIDLEFPPTAASLSNKPVAACSVVVTWRRVSDFLSPGYSVIEDGATPLDIRQGTLGDCWLLSALSCLAEFPAQVEALFRTNASPTPRLTPSAFGVYSVRLCISGEWTDVRLDDFIPCSPLGGPVYARNHGNELWVLLVEKAFAKAMGAYSALEGGFAYEALMVSGRRCAAHRVV
jgi:hypothetical protein